MASLIPMKSLQNWKINLSFLQEANQHKPCCAARTLANELQICKKKKLDYIEKIHCYAWSRLQLDQTVISTDISHVP
jgi:hypothetical protein